MAQGIRTQTQLEEFVKAYEQFDEFVFDVETMGDHRLDPRRNDVFWISFAGPGRTDVIPMGHPVGERVLYDDGDELHRIVKGKKYQERRINETSGRLKWFDVPPQFTPAPTQLWRSDVMEAIRPLFFSERRKVNQKVKFDTESCSKYWGGLPPGPYGDTIVAAKLVDENQLSYDLGSLVRRLLRYKYEKIGKSVETHPFSEAFDYSYLDAASTWLVWRILKRRLKGAGVAHVFDEIEMPLLPYIMDMEMTGMAIDRKILDSLNEEFLLELATHQEAIDQRAGKHINLNAPRQKAELVYDILGKPCRVYTKTGQRSTAKGVLDPYKRNKTIARVLEYSQLQKLQSSFIDPLYRFTIEGRVHPDFDQAGARSGRTSCREPNIQQIPSRTERGHRVREMFMAAPGNRLIVADLSQIELRVLAHFTRDPRLVKAYDEGLDLHAMTARAVWGDDFTPLHRLLAKNGNFSCVFGAFASTLVLRYEFPNLKVADDFLQRFYATYREVNPWKQRVWNQARKKYKKGHTAPYVETLLGRRRRLPELMAYDRKLNAAAERQAISTVIQGSAADLFKVIMLETGAALKEQSWEGHVLMTVHDEILVEVPQRHAEEGLALVKETMENIANPFTGDPILSVPIVADAKIVKRWSEAK